MDVDRATNLVIGVGIRIHRLYSPGLLESAYEMILVEELLEIGLDVQRQKGISINHKGLVIPNAYFADLIINNELVVELKACEKLMPVHIRQLHTYLKFTGMRVGLLMNFGGATLREGLKRIVNDYTPPPFSKTLREK